MQTLIADGGSALGGRMYEIEKDELRLLTAAEIEEVGGGDGDNDTTTTTTLTVMTTLTVTSPVCTTTTTTTTSTTLTKPWQEQV